MSSPQHRWLLAAGGQSTRDADLVARAERYGDELDTRDVRTTVTVLVCASLALMAAIAFIASQTASPPFLSTLEDRPACSASTAVQVQPAPPALDRDTVRALLVRGHSARVAP